MSKKEGIRARNKEEAKRIYSTSKKTAKYYGTKNEFVIVKTVR